MRANRVRNAAAVALALALGIGGVSQAQEQPQVSGELGVEKKAALTPAEQAEAAENIKQRADKLATRITKLLDEARREKDIIRANCLNRKLTEVNANNRTIEQRNLALRNASETGDATKSSHEFTVLSVVAQKLDSLEREAAQCLGQSMYEAGASQVVTTVPPQVLLMVDPTQPVVESPAPPAVTIPPPLSPSR